MSRTHTRRRGRRSRGVALKPADKFRLLCLAAHIPDPLWGDDEVVFHSERKWRFDFAWPNQMVAVEIHGNEFGGKPCTACGHSPGGRHVRGTGFRADRVKMREAQLLGWTVLEFCGTEYGDAEGSEMVIDTVKRALKIRDGAPQQAQKG